MNLIQTYIDHPFMLLYATILFLGIYYALRKDERKSVKLYKMSCPVYLGITWALVLIQR
ncbi:MAG: hypothetical protein ACRC1P_10300 [Cellulosilyticaceae bacterium]